MSRQQGRARVLRTGCLGQPRQNRRFAPPRPLQSFLGALRIHPPHPETACRPQRDLKPGQRPPSSGGVLRRSANAVSSPAANAARRRDRLRAPRLHHVLHRQVLDDPRHAPAPTSGPRTYPHSDVPITRKPYDASLRRPLPGEVAETAPTQRAAICGALTGTAERLGRVLLQMLDPGKQGVEQRRFQAPARP